MLNLPKSWGEINLSQWEELRALELDPTCEGIDLFCEQLAVLLNTDAQDPIISDISIDDLFFIMEDLKWLKISPRPQFPKEINQYYFQDLNRLKLGEFIDIEHYMNEGISRVPEIAAILYKQKRYNDWGHEEWEPYEYSPEQRAKEFDLNVSQIWGIWEKYSEWKEEFMKKYDPLFADTSQIPEEFEEEISGYDKIESKKQEAIDRARQQFSWENVLWSLTNGDVSKFDAVFGCNVVLVFNTLSMKRVLDI